MAEPITDADLEAFLDEALAPADMARVEAAVRGDEGLTARMIEINAERDLGGHSLGAVWRRSRLTCPERGQLGSYLLGVLSDGEAGYIRFHLEQVGCRCCLANVEDLAAKQQEKAEAAESRRRKYFQSSAGYLRRK